MLASIRTALFDLDPGEASFDVRGFAATTDDKRQRLEAAGGAFVAGYRASIRQSAPGPLADVCEDRPRALWGFAYEGAAMGLTILDLCTSGSPRRFKTFLEQRGHAHRFMLHVGAGWAIARCPWGTFTFLPRLDPLLRWLTVDGIGFHQAFFKPSRLHSSRPAMLRRCGAQAYDAGLGRAMWFVTGGQPASIIDHIARFAPERRRALWSGVGLAVVYAGGATGDDLRQLTQGAGQYRPYLAVGASFAAAARDSAGNATEETDPVCRALTGLSAANAAERTYRIIEEVTPGVDALDHCRTRLVAQFETPAGVAVAS